MRSTPTPPVLLLRRLLRSIENNGLRPALAHSWQRLARSLRNHGLSGTLDRAFVHAPKVPPRAQTPTHPYDLAQGIDTSGFIPGSEVDRVSASGVYANAYVGIYPSALRPALAALPLRLEDFTFVDLGCGKGRALFIAAEFPFRHLLGVELATDLARTAQKNVATNADWAARIDVLNEDATRVTYPDGPLLIFLFHPFLAPVLRKALANLERQLRHTPREIYVLYGRNPHYTEVLNDFPFLRQISENGYPYSAEDLAVDCSGLSHETFTLYSADVTRK